MLQERMIEVNRSFEVLTGPTRQAVDAELPRQRADEARREQELRREQAHQQEAWEAARRRAGESPDRV